MPAHALGERQLVPEPCPVPRGRVPWLATAVREQMAASSLGRREAWVANCETADGLLQGPWLGRRRIGEAGHAVGAHALRKGKEAVLRRRDGRRRGRNARNTWSPAATAAAGSHDREREGGGEEKGTAAEHHVRLPSVESGEGPVN